MTTGWEEMRLTADGRWQPTGQLRDQFPEVFRQGRTLYGVIGTDTDGWRRKVWMTSLPLHPDGVVGTLGWAELNRIESAAPPF